MDLPALETRQDVHSFVADLLDRDELWSLVAAFADGPDGLDHRISDLEERLAADGGGTATGTWSVSEQLQMRRIIASWQATAEAGRTPVPVDPVGRVGWLSQYAAGRWDLRLGRERDSIPASGEMFSPPVTRTIYALADAWGMTRGVPASGRFDCALVLGGLIRANITRPHVLADLLAADAVGVDQVVGLGSDRSLSPAERELAARVGCRAGTEVEALEFGLAEAFGSTSSHWASTPIGGVRRLSTHAGPEVLAAGAPNGPGGMRPNTGEAFEWLLGLPDVGSRCGSAILAVTTPIYWLQNHAALLVRIPEGASLTTTGGAPGPVSSLLAQTFRAQHYLQEVKASIDAMLRLLAWAGP